MTKELVRLGSRGQMETRLRGEKTQIIEWFCEIPRVIL